MSRVETLRRDASQLSRRRFITVFAIDIEKLTYRWWRVCRQRQSHAPETVRERIANTSKTLLAEAGHGGKSTIMRGRFEICQRFKPEIVV